MSSKEKVVKTLLAISKEKEVSKPPVAVSKEKEVYVYKPRVAVSKEREVYKPRMAVSNEKEVSKPPVAISKEEVSKPLVAVSGRLIGVSLAPVAVADLEVDEPHLNVAIKPRQLDFPRYPENGKPPARRMTIINNGPTPIAFKLLTSDNNSYGVSTKFGIVAGRSSGKSRRTDVRIFRKLPDSRSGDTGEKPIKNHLQVLVTELRDPQLTAELTFRQPEIKCDRYKIQLLYTAIPAPAKSQPSGPSLPSALKGGTLNKVK